jgi:hypothetical protein
MKTWQILGINSQSYLSIVNAHENLADIRHKFSIISKHSQSMHNELRYEAKIHTISTKLFKRKKKSASFPHFFFKKNCKWKTTKTCFKGKENKN